MTLEPIDLRHQAPGIVALLPPRDRRRPRAVRLWPDLDDSSPEGGAREPRARARRRAAPAALAHPPRSRGRGRRARARAPGTPGARVRDRRAAPRRSVEARRERAAAVRRRLRRALGRARADSEENVHVVGDASRRPRVLPDARTRVASRVVSRRERNALRGRRRGRSTRRCAVRHAALPSAGARSRRVGEHDRRDRAARARSTCAHPLRPVRRRAGAPRGVCARPSAGGESASSTGWTRRRSSPRPPTTSRETDPELVDEYQRAGPYWHHFRGIERYWRKRREPAL